MHTFIGLHIGAGYHSDKLHSSYEQLCNNACRKGMQILKDGGDSLEAVVTVTEILENSPLTNAGYGSCLTWDGTVECDACVMDGKTLNFGAVGAVSGIPNPVQVAKALCLNQRQALSLGRVHPNILVGEGAHKWAVNAGVKPTSPLSLISDKANQRHIKYKRKAEKHNENCSLENGSVETTVFNSEDEEEPCVQKAPINCKLEQMEITEERNNESDSSNESGNSDQFKIEKNVNQDKHSLKLTFKRQLDTVGAVAVDSDGIVASSCSSGGLFLKSCGRVGQAACFGCGCWAENRLDEFKSVAVSTSGTGEDLIKTNLARAVANDLFVKECAVSSLHETINTSFLNSRLLSSQSQKLCGLITLIGREGKGEFVYGHTSSSMGIGFMSSKQKNPKFLLSRLPVSVNPGSQMSIVAVPW